jgi:hypothetical protein
MSKSAMMRLVFWSKPKKNKVSFPRLIERGPTIPLSEGVRRYQRIIAHLVYQATKIQNYSKGDIHGPNKCYTTRQHAGTGQERDSSVP